MKIQNIIRMNVLVMGAGAILFFTATVQSQEIENTAWHDGPSVSASSKPAPTPAPPAANKNSSIPDNLSMTPGAPVSSPTAKQNSGTSRWASVELLLLASLLGSIIIVAINSLAEARRANRQVAARVRAINPKPTLP